MVIKPSGIKKNCESCDEKSQCVKPYSFETYLTNEYQQRD